MTRILLLESIHPVARERLSAAGFDVELIDGALSENELAKRLPGVSAIGIRSKTQMPKSVLERAPDLLAIGAFCIGTNQVDLVAAQAGGTAVFNAPFSNTRSVAELVLAEVVMLSRGLGDRVREMHKGHWRKSAKGSHEVRGKTLGVIGYGHIGSQIGVLAEAFGMQVRFFDVVGKLPMGNNRPAASLDELLSVSDFVTLHVPETEETKNMFGERELQAMKPGSCLINLSRGSVVDVDALASALKSGHLLGAAVDVFPTEPKANLSDGFESPLLGLPNTILTPHIGGSTLEAQENIGGEVSDALIRFLSKGSSMGAVNFPRVEPPRTASHRVTNVHRNVPGVLSDINRIVAGAGANVQAQVLATQNDLGYLIMDFDSDVSKEVSERMRELPTTLRARALS